MTLAKHVTISPYRMRCFSRYMLELSMSLKPGTAITYRGYYLKSKDGSKEPDSANPPLASNIQRYNIFLIYYDLLDRMYDIGVYARLKDTVGLDPTNEKWYLKKQDCSLAYDVHDPDAGSNEKFHHAAFEKYITGHVQDLAALAACPDPDPVALSKLRSQRTDNFEDTPLPTIGQDLRTLIDTFINRKHAALKQWIHDCVDGHGIKCALFCTTRTYQQYDDGFFMENDKFKQNVVAAAMADEGHDFSTLALRIDKQLAEQTIPAKYKNPDSGDSETEEELAADKLNGQAHPGFAADGTDLSTPTPWHALPAANGLYLKRTRGYPLQKRAIPEDGFVFPDGKPPAPHLISHDPR